MIGVYLIHLSLIGCSRSNILSRESVCHGRDYSDAILAWTCLQILLLGDDVTQEQRTGIAAILFPRPVLELVSSDPFELRSINTSNIVFFLSFKIFPFDDADHSKRRLYDYRLFLCSTR